MWSVLLFIGVIVRGILSCLDYICPGKPLFSHNHGLVEKKSHNVVSTVMFWVLAWLSHCAVLHILNINNSINQRVFPGEESLMLGSAFSFLVSLRERACNIFCGIFASQFALPVSVSVSKSQFTLGLFGQSKTEVCIFGGSRQPERDICLTNTTGPILAL